MYSCNKDQDKGGPRNPKALAKPYRETIVDLHSNPGT
jgi:hypothetical protein